LSPILVRPVREQLEHDRIIRLLQARYRRRYEAGINTGAEQVAAVGSGPSALYPDLVLTSVERGRRLEVVVEVETGESVNHLEALAEWAPYSKIRAAFHLYVPSGMVEVGRRLCADNHIAVSEIWSYHSIGEDVRFTLIHKTRESAPVARRVHAAPVAPPARKPPAATKRPVRAVNTKRPVRAVKTAAARKTAARKTGKKQVARRAAAGHSSRSTAARTQKRK
jgi:hypothetical protein